MRAGGRRRGTDPSATTSRRSRWTPDVLGVLWTVLAAVVVLAPALRPGVSLGPFALLAHAGLTSHAGIPVHNPSQSDQILFFSPMTDLAWQQVHSGHLPLWNPYNVLGTPLAFNWESAVFSLPLLISYLVHASFAYMVVVLVKLVIAGSGVYVCCRSLGLKPISSAFGGTLFELSGTIVHYSGWSIVGVECWYGWILGAAILLVKGRHRARDTVLLAVALAFAIYGGYPAGLLLIAIALLLFFLVFFLFRPTEIRSPFVPIANLAVAGVCGVALGAPLLLPGLQTVSNSARKFAPGSSAVYPVSHVANLLAAGLQGENFKTSAYLGVFAIVLAVVAARTMWKRPEVRGLTLVAVVSAFLTFFSPADRLLQSVPGGTSLHWDQAVGTLTLALALLAAIGFDHLRRDPLNQQATRWAFAVFAACGIVILAVFTADVLKLSAAVHLGGLFWPAVQVAFGLAVFGYLTFARPRGRPAWISTASFGRGMYGLVLTIETAFLITSGVSFWSLSSTFYSPTPAVQQLQAVVGDGIVGFGTCKGLGSSRPTAGTIGIRPDANIGYAVHEFAVYDPILPESYYRSWFALRGVHTPSSLSRLGIFCAPIFDSTEAKVYGVSFLLEPPGRPGPAGGVRALSLGGETLYRIPGAAQATTVPLSYYGVPIPTVFQGQPDPVVVHSPTSWSVVVKSKTPQFLRLRLSAVPGWHATIDGRGLPLGTWASGAMLDARVPAGTYVVRLQYWPSLFSTGIHIVLIAVLLMAVGVAVAWFRTRRMRASPHSNAKTEASPQLESDHAPNPT